MAQEPLQILKPDGTLAKKAPLLTDEDLLSLYRHMLRIRLLDERMMGLQRQGRIGFYGEARGEEAAVIGSAYALEPEDWIYPALRQGGAALLRGFPLRKYVAQLMGNAEDLMKGHMQPCHYAAREVNHVSWSSCIANQLPAAVGTAMAMKYRGDDRVVMAYLGDGATSASEFHVAMNFAGVFEAPVVFLCQNNHWSISVPLERQTASPDLAVKAKAYGFPGVRVDGNDVLAVYAAAREAVDRARSGGGPAFIEAVTYRMGAHSTADDPSRYRSEEEVEKWKRRDPLSRFRAYLEDQGLHDEAREEDLRLKLEEEIGQAVRQAERAGPPPTETLFEDVYDRLPWNLREQRDGLTPPAGKEE